MRKIWIYIVHWMRSSFAPTVSWLVPINVYVSSLSPLSPFSLPRYLQPLSLSLSLSLSPCTSAQHECISLLEAAKQAKAAVSEAQDLVATRKDQLESAKGDIQDVLPAIENAYADADQQVCCACSLSLSLCIPFFFLLLTSNPFFLSSQLHLRFAELRSKLDQREQQLRLQLSETKEFKLQYVPTPLPLFCTMHLATRLSLSLSLSLSVLTLLPVLLHFRFYKER
eukprot:TRINITY_DN734_c0_g1_i12.p1 TRINITY_DN734_c0_g1~~TRINITY_DN734_c0_g1_i12.p1  ORF type:complete len:225 (-),score=47.60 TRINITY_DN734_c0_g1_i12:777-1451(-)